MVDTSVVNGLNWYWIVIQLVVPLVVGVLISTPFWRKSDFIFGNVVGSGIIFACAIGLIFREYVEVDRAVQACIDAGTTCFPTPSAFARFAIHAAIGLGEVFVLFTVSLAVERRIRNRGYAAEWRR